MRIFVMSRSFLLRLTVVPDKAVEKFKTHFLWSVTGFPPPPPKKKNLAVYEIIWKKGQTIDDNMANALCLLDTKGYKHKLRLSNTGCFSIATTGA